MKNFIPSFVVSAFVIVSASSQLQAAGPDREALAKKYPSIEEGSRRPENKKILCPFQRLLERAGIYDASKKNQSGLYAGILVIGKAAQEFGCKLVGCSAASTFVSGGQILSGTTHVGAVNLEALHKAVGSGHEGGFFYAKGGTVVSDEVRKRTLAMIQARADSMGRVSREDLEIVKQQICDEQQVEYSEAMKVEIVGIYSFLGGNDRGFIDYADVERFAHGELPKTLGEIELPF